MCASWSCLLPLYLGEEQAAKLVHFTLPASPHYLTMSQVQVRQCLCAGCCHQDRRGGFRSCHSTISCDAALPLALDLDLDKGVRPSYVQGGLLPQICEQQQDQLRIEQQNIFQTCEARQDDGAFMTNTQQRYRLEGL